MHKPIKYTVVTLIIISLLASLYLNIFRVRAEAANKKVQILIDYDELCALAHSHGIELEELAARFKAAGATGVIVRERTLEDFRAAGDIALLKGGEAALLQEGNSSLLAGLAWKKEHTLIITKDPAVYKTISEDFQALKKDMSTAQNGEYYLISASVTAKEAELMGVGFFYADLEAIHKGGLMIVPRLRDYSKVSKECLDVMAARLAEMPGLSMVAFNDPAILGINNTPYLAQKLGELDVPVGMFEFFNQAGLKQLAKQMEKKVIRVHSISETDMARYNEQQAVDRYRLAVAERNIRSVYLRFFGISQPATALDRALDYTQTVRETLLEEGYVASEPADLKGIPYSRAVIFPIGLGVVAAGVLALSLLTTNPFWLLAAGAGGVLGWAGFLYIDPLLARKAMALGSVVLYPVLGIIYVLKEQGRTMPEAVLALAKMSAVSLLGALIMTGLLADKSFMLTLDIFSGVKLAHLLPLVLIPGYYFFKEPDPLKRSRAILNKPVLNKEVLLGLLIMAALAVYIIRTGNDAPQLVSSWETRLRAFLDGVLGVRPRTKEFLLGHPAMLVLLYYGYDRRKLGILLLAIIGQVSLVNTYAHIHTPLLISVIRSFHGLWLGIIIGLIVIACIRYLLKWLQVKGALEQ